MLLWSASTFLSLSRGLVTAFSEVGYYSKPEPTSMPDMENTLRSIACWDYIIKADLKLSFYWISPVHSSKKYCGVGSPFNGVHVYTRCAMGMPGSVTGSVVKIMGHAIGHLAEEGSVAEIVDDLNCFGKSPEQPSTWARVSEVLLENNVSLCAPKTVICTKSTNIIGWFGQMEH